MEANAHLLIAAAAAAAAARAIVVGLIFGAVAPVSTLMVALRQARKREVELGQRQRRQRTGRSY